MLVGTGYLDDAYVCSIPAGKSLNAQRHMFEELVFILEGRGATTVWQTQGTKQSFEWQKGSLFAIPLNALYQHFNGQGDREARILAVTTAPLIFNLFRSEDFVLNNPYAFSDRFQGEEGYFGGKGVLYSDRVVETNFVADAVNIEPVAWTERGKGNATIFFEMAQSMMGSHVSRFPVGLYKKRIGMGPGLMFLFSPAKVIHSCGPRVRREPVLIGGPVRSLYRRKAGFTSTSIPAWSPPVTWRLRCSAENSNCSPVRSSPMCPLPTEAGR